MTPRPLDWRSVERKLTRIRRLVDQLITLGPFDRARLDTDTVATLAAERILTLLVDLAFATNGHVTVAVLKQAPDSPADAGPGRAPVPGQPASPAS